MVAKTDIGRDVLPLEVLLGMLFDAIFFRRGSDDAMGHQVRLSQHGGRLVFGRVSKVQI